jgi:hypothetical protein
MHGINMMLQLGVGDLLGVIVDEIVKVTFTLHGSATQGTSKSILPFHGLGTTFFHGTSSTKLITI